MFRVYIYFFPLLGRSNNSTSYFMCNFFFIYGFFLLEKQHSRGLEKKFIQNHGNSRKLQQQHYKNQNGILLHGTNIKHQRY